MMTILAPKQRQLEPTSRALECLLERGHSLSANGDAAERASARHHTSAVSGRAPM